MRSDEKGTEESKRNLQQFLADKAGEVSGSQDLEDAVRPLQILFSDAEAEEKGDDASVEGRATKSPKSSPKNFTNYSHYKRYMQVDSNELSTEDKIRFLLTATFDGESILDEVTNKP